MPLSPDEEYLARHCYGYGHWGADYWYIGLEEGQSKDGRDTISARAEVWKELKAKGMVDDGLCDIRAFHNHPKIDKKWFMPPRPPTQTTWRYLILSLKAHKGMDEGLEAIRAYQLNRWGRSDPKIGETCLIELSGLPANSLSTAREREAFRHDRTEVIRKKLLKYRPKFVVIYGNHQHKHWDQIIQQLKRDIPTQFLSVESPTARTARGKSKREYWKSVGQSLRHNN